MSTIPKFIFILELYFNLWSRIVLHKLFIRDLQLVTQLELDASLIDREQHDDRDREQGHERDADPEQKPCSQ